MLREQAERAQQHLPFLASRPCVSVSRTGATANGSDEILLQLSIRLSPETATNDAALKMLAIHVTVDYIKVLLIKRHCRNLFNSRGEKRSRRIFTVYLSSKQEHKSVILTKSQASGVMCYRSRHSIEKHTKMFF